MRSFERVDWDAYLPTLKRLWDEGASAGQIALKIPNSTRSGICGKVRRLGLAERKFASGATITTAHRHKAAAAASRPRRAKTAKPKLNGYTDIMATTPAPLPWTPKADDFEPPIEQRKTLMQLDTRTCRYPFGDPIEEGFYFCGGVTEDDKPYCQHHCRIAFEPLTRRAQKSVQRFATIDNQGVKHHAY